MPLSLTEFLAASLAVVAGSVLQGSVGFGLGLLAAPILVLINPRLIPAPLLLLALILNVLILYRERQSIDVRGLPAAMTGRLLGIGLAIVVLLSIQPDIMALGFGILVLLAVALSASGLHFHPTPFALAGAGALSGFMATTIAIGGPPMGLVYQDSSGSRLRGTLAGYFIFGVILSLVGLAIIGRLGNYELWSALALVPAATVGFLISVFAARILDRGYTRKAVLIVSAVAGLIVIARQLL